ncbi:MAG: hypothetical protein LC753_14240 [Acidobacteria bacterium]|nr:hypothetical protein [Acidobacteriota bacterium]MCA1651378.1 hypothetical protein [Acidobacteriota bacterium]
MPQHDHRAAALHAVLAALLLGVVSTLGDFVWAALELRHRVAYGLVHGAVICFCIGIVLGVRAGRPLPGGVAGPLIGVLAAGTFYALAPMMGMGAMFVAWMLFWLCFALVQAWLVGERPNAAVLTRGLAAAVLSGLAFYAISGIWTHEVTRNPNYLRNLLSWTFAFLPGFMALFWPRRA